MQGFEVKHFSSCLNLGTMLLQSLRFPKHSVRPSLRGEAEKQDIHVVQALVFPLSA